MLALLARSLAGMALPCLAGRAPQRNPCRLLIHLCFSFSLGCCRNLANLKVQGTLPPELKLANELVNLNLQGNK